MNTKLYVGNLPYQTTESDLQTLFEATGEVSSINIVRDRAKMSASPHHARIRSSSSGNDTLVSTGS